MLSVYESSLDDCYKLRVLDRMRELLANDERTRDLFQKTIRQFPISAVRETDDIGSPLPPAVSLYSPVDTSLVPVTVGGAGVGRQETVFACVLEVALFCGQTTTPDVLDALMRRLANATDAFQQTVLRYREDPSPAPRLWHLLNVATPATVMERVPGTMLLTMTRFSLVCQRRMP